MNFRLIQDNDTNPELPIERGRNEKEWAAGYRR
jgi:hypothetical protein